ncbi:S1C family serine protease [Sinorhizobium garamanticum]|uniref:S1C family serine protease n=1 Tax=Sinorhizobium garamanticum TaxID=680247 RepID=A0ABY8DIY3_9HYPH|nr:S1C family serine protease [Sinorhizobium garamanticum]WEX90875.1 S1C family serine protease [Sinorhizobium garamanticum]
MPKASLADFSREIAGLVAATAAGIAAVHASRHSSSSAVHWREGLFVAASEAIETEEGITLTLPSGNSAAAELVGRDPTTGIAVLKSDVPDGASALKPAGPTEAGNLVVAVGRWEASTLAGFGIVSEAGPAWRSMRGGLIDRRIRLSASIDPRAEGGAAIDAEGGFIGLVLFDPRRRALVIPAETVDRVAATLAEKGHMPRGYLGAGLHPVRQEKVRGAMVMSLEAGGPAEKVGLVLGDIITSWNGETVEGVRDLIRKIGPDSVGKTVALGILRGGEARTLDVVVGARPRS